MSLRPTHPAADVIDLGGEWEYRPDPKALGEHYAGQLAYTHWDDARWMRDTGSGEWTPVTVPGPWPETSALTGSMIWFRRHFNVEGTSDGWRLAFDGVNYRADVWLNGTYLGTHEHAFAPFSFDVTDVVRDDNLLVVRVTPATDVLGEEDQMGQFKRAFVGALGRWDMNDPEHKPAGIWAGVRLVAEPAQAIVGGTIDYAFDHDPDPADPDGAIPVAASLRVELLGRGPAVSAVLGWRVTPVGFRDRPQAGEVPVTVFPGARTTTADIDLLVRPWWTWDLGQPRLYDVQVWLYVDGERVHEHAWRTGFRQVTRGEGWDLRLNGVALYQRGANYLSDIDLSSMTPERYELDVRLFKAANLNTVHPFCVVEAPGLYAECDRQGLIVYQDIPLWLMVDTSSETVTRAIDTFDAMLTTLRPYPSVAIWNFGSQPSTANFEKLCVALVRHAHAADPSRIAHHANAAIAYERHEDVHPTRSFFWARDEADRFVDEYGWHRDAHMYPGWYFGELGTISELPLEDFALVTEFGGQALPDKALLAEFMDVDGPIDWQRIARRCGQPDLLRLHNPGAESLDELIKRSQAHQAALVRHHTEFIRGRKGDPGRGLHLFAFNDCWPSVTWSVVDYRRNAKPAYTALAIAMEPVQAFLCRPDQPLDDGDGQLEVAIVNDGPLLLAGVRLSVEIATDDGSTRSFDIPAFDLPTDRAIRRRVPVDLPDRSSMDSLTLVIAWGDTRVRNHYAMATD